MIKRLIDRGADATATEETHHTPLHLASHKEAAQLLIDAGADVNAKTERMRETLLHSAAWVAAQGAPKSYENYLYLTKLLISKGADVNVKLKTGSMIQDDQPYRDKSPDMRRLRSLPATKSRDVGAGKREKSRIGPRVSKSRDTPQVSPAMEIAV